MRAGGTKGPWRPESIGEIWPLGAKAKQVVSTAKATTTLLQQTYHERPVVLVSQHSA